MERSVSIDLLSIVSFAALSMMVYRKSAYGSNRIHNPKFSFAKGIYMPMTNSKSDALALLIPTRDPYTTSYQNVSVSE